MDIPESDRPILKAINENIGLQSLLWDLDMMPEQLTPGTEHWSRMKLAAVAFMHGKAYGASEVLDKWQKAHEQAKPTVEPK